MKTQTKICNDCEEMKPLESFGLRKYKTKKGIKTIPMSFCRSCAIVRAYAWQNANTEKYRKYLAKYYKQRRKHEEDSA